MDKMIETPRHNVLSFRVTDQELQEIVAAKPGGHKGTFIRKMVFAGLASQQQANPSEESA